VVVSLGAKIPTAPLSMPRSQAARDAVAALSREHSAMLLAGNGALALGADLAQAYLRMELVEHYARIVSLARQMGRVAELSPAQVQELLEARRRAGLSPPRR
jgi:L-fuculose-phosphate aldolase